MALWIKRYLIIIPTLESPLLPTQDTRANYVHYHATWVEWALTLAGIATFLLFFTLVARFVTVIPISDAGEKEKSLVGSTSVSEKEIATA